MHSVEVSIEILLGVLVARQHVEVVAVDLDVAADGHVSRRDELLVLVHILVLSALKELALHDARVLLGGFVNGDGVVREEELNDEAAVDILGHACVEAGCVAEDLSFVVNRLEEVLLGLLRDQAVNVAERVNLVTEAVVRWDLSLCRISGLGVLNSAQIKVSIKFLLVEVEGELVNASDVELATEGLDEAAGVELVGCVVVVTHVLEAGLCHLEVTRQSLSLHQESEVVAAVVRVVNLSNLNGVIGQEVVNDKGEVVEAGVETQDSAIVVEELLLALHSATAKGLLHILLEAWVSELLLGDLLLSEAVLRNSLRLTLWLSKSLYI